jgi:hypothetical protein
MAILTKAYLAPEVVRDTDAERFVDRFSVRILPNEPCVLDFTACRHVDVGAGFRIGNVLRRLSSGRELIVHVPRIDFDAGVSDTFFRAFTRSGLGPAIARFSSSVLSDGVEIGAALAAYYKRTLEVGTQNVVYFPDLHLGTLDVEDEGRFTTRFLAVLPRVNVHPVELEERALRSLVGLCFEAVQNVVDHATKKPLPPGTTILSYLSLRYYKAVSTSGDGVMAAYLRRLVRETRTESVRMLEIVVNDDGVGLPARHTLDMDTYWKDFRREAEIVGEATSNSSVKIRSGDARVRGGVAGAGYTKMRECLAILHAFASLRTGRCLAYLDGLAGKQERFSLAKDPRGQAFGYMPGTALQILMPLPPARIEDKQPSLF